MLTDIALRKLKSEDVNRKISDFGGLFILVTPAGGKLWRWKYRVGGKEKLLTLGAYPEVSLVEARKRRDHAREKLKNGIDPCIERKLKKIRAGNTFAEVAKEWMENFGRGVAGVTIEKRWIRLRKHVFPVIGDRAVGDIKAMDMLQIARVLENKGKASTAHMVIGICSRVFQFAVGTGRADRDPTRDIVKVLQPVPKGKHRAAPLVPKIIGALLRQIDEYKGMFTTRYAIRMAPFLVVRPGELQKMRWSDIDLVNATWSFRVTKADIDHIVPLPRQVIGMLRELHSLTGDGQFVFPSALTNDRPVSPACMIMAYRRMGIAKDELSTHGWRATFRTLGAEILKFREDLMEHQLSHAVRDPLGRAYNRTQFVEERREMMQKWADYLEGLKTGRA